jgi:hypothetical protein
MGKTMEDDFYSSITVVYPLHNCGEIAAFISDFSGRFS